MKVIIKSKISKEEVRQMPDETFPGEIFVIDTRREAQRALKYLSQFDIVGIDSETRPSFTKGETHSVALLQVSTIDTCFLFRLNIIGIQPAMLKLLANPDIKKVGLSLRDDFLALNRLEPVDHCNSIDLQDYVPAFGIEEKGLQKVYAILFGKRITKTQQLSNWENRTLTERQQQYAAIDAWACLRIYNLLQELIRTGEYELCPVESDDEPQ